MIALASISRSGARASEPELWGSRRGRQGTRLRSGVHSLNEDRRSRRLIRSQGLDDSGTSGMGRRRQAGGGGALGELAAPFAEPPAIHLSLASPLARYQQAVHAFSSLLPALQRSRPNPAPWSQPQPSTSSQAGAWARASFGNAAKGGGA